VKPWLRHTIWLAIPLSALAVGWAGWSGVRSASESRRELAELQARKARLEGSMSQLKREVAALRREREARARAAREALDVAAPGEVLVVVPEPTKAK